MLYNGVLCSYIFKIHWQSLMGLDIKIEFKTCRLGTSLVAQWLRVHLPVQGMWVRALVQEDPTCRRATKPVRHNYWACALEPLGHNC